MRDGILARLARLGAAAAIVATAGAATAGAAAAQTTEMKLGFITINDTQHESAKYFAEEVAKRSGGAVQAKLFPAGQLGTIARQIEGLQFGTQEAFYTPPGFMVGINPALQVGDAPGLFDSIWHQHKALNHPLVRDKLLTAAERANILGMYLWCASTTAIVTRNPVRTLDDLKGLKLRVLATKVEVALVRAYGATGVPMDFTEVVPAIQNGTVDGTRIAKAVLVPSRFYTVAKHMYDETTGYLPSGLWVSKGWFEKLPEAQRRAIREASEAVTDRSGRFAVEFAARGDAAWRENGGEIVRPSPADRAELDRRARAVSEETLTADPAVKAMYELMKQAADATRGATPPSQ